MVPNLQRLRFRTEDWLFRIYLYLSIYLSNLFIFGCAVFIVARAFSLAVVSWGYSLVVVCGLLIAVSSLVAERGL